MGSDPAEHRVIGAVTDIMAQKRAEELLSRTRAQADLALRASNAGLWTVDLATGDVSLDQRARTIFGLSDELVRYEQVIARIHDKDRAMHEAAVAQALNPAGTGRYEGEYRLLASKDAIRTVGPLARTVGVRRWQAGAVCRYGA